MTRGKSSLHSGLKSGKLGLRDRDSPASTNMHGPPSRRALLFLGYVFSRLLTGAGESPAPSGSLTGHAIPVENIVQSLGLVPLARARRCGSRHARGAASRALRDIFTRKCHCAMMLARCRLGSR